MTSSSSAIDDTPATTPSGPSGSRRHGPANATAAMSRANPRMVPTRAGIGCATLHHGTSCARNVEIGTAPLITPTIIMARPAPATWRRMTNAAMP